MLLMGMALVGGAAVSLVGTSLLPLDQEVGTHASAAGAVLGIGLMAAAVNPAGNIGPVFFGLAFSLLLIATYPERKQLVRSTTPAPSPVKSAPPGEDKPAEPAE